MEPYVKSFQYKYFTLMPNVLKLDISSVTNVLFARLNRKGKTGPSVMAEGHAVWRATSRRENLGYFESELWLNPKGGERGSSSSSVSSNTELKKARMNEEEEETNSLRDLIQNLTANMESNFAKLHEELCGLRQEMKEEIDMLKSNISYLFGSRCSSDKWTLSRDNISKIQLSLADGNFELFSFSANLSFSFLF